MGRFKYESSKGAVIELDGPLSFVGIAEQARSRSWAYDLRMRNIAAVSRPAREAKLSVWATFAQADEMRKAFDSDMFSGEPGFFIVNDEWKQRAFVVAQDVKSAMLGELIAELTIILLDGAWWRLASVPFIPDSGVDPEQYPYLDYDFDFAIDYGRPPLGRSVSTDATNPSPVRITVYGPATNPAITAGSYLYQVNASVPSGGYLVIDGKEKTINLVGSDGSITNEFANGVRGSGEGGGQYIFEPVPTEEITISWNNSFEFEFGWYQEEGEPPWLS